MFVCSPSANTSAHPKTWCESTTITREVHHFYQSFRRTVGVFLQTLTGNHSVSLCRRNECILLVHRLNDRRVWFGFVHQTSRVLSAFQVSWNVRLRKRSTGRKWWRRRHLLKSDYPRCDVIRYQIYVTLIKLLIRLLWFLMFEFKASHQTCVRVCQRADKVLYCHVAAAERFLSPTLTFCSLLAS